ncbi:MAG: hypothetical protein A2075_21480 [Geobacteraceae bacterium GWC2_58_44]|nr:MAG: hypothetical protein A2075_21480 [Geobacteraceae bacterium GWC2_58_44]
MKRHENALGIMEGACNLRAIARSLVEAADEATGEGIGAEQDAAVRMIVHRLARLCRVDEITCGYDTETLNDVYCTLMKECLTRAKEGAASPVRVVEPITLLRAPQRMGLPEGVQN